MENIAILKRYILFILSQQEQLVQKKNAVSIVWTHFGFSKKRQN